MNFGDLRFSYSVVCLGLCLVILGPTLALVVRFPAGERFSELWILGPGRMAEDYPFNVESGGDYRVFLGVGNRMGGLECYQVFVKVRNQSEALPNSFNGTASVLEPVFEFRVFLEDGTVWDVPVDFSFNEVSFGEGVVRVGKMVLNGSVLSVDKVVVWDDVNGGFYFQVFFELWIYDSVESGFLYHNRFVSLWLNMTVVA